MVNKRFSMSPSTRPRFSGSAS